MHLQGATESTGVRRKKTNCDVPFPFSVPFLSNRVLRSFQFLPIKSPPLGAPIFTNKDSFCLPFFNQSSFPFLSVPILSNHKLPSLVQLFPMKYGNTAFKCIVGDSDDSVNIEEPRGIFNDSTGKVRIKLKLFTFQN